MTLGSTQPLTEMSTRSFPGGKGGRCVGLTTLPPSCAVVTKSGNLNFLEPSGLVQASNGIAAIILTMEGSSLRRQRRQVRRSLICYIESCKDGEKFTLKL